MKKRNLIKWRTRAAKREKPRQKPIPWLDEYIRSFNAKSTSKTVAARNRAHLATALMNASEPFPVRERV